MENIQTDRKTGNKRALQMNTRVSHFQDQYHLWF